MEIQNTQNKKIFRALFGNIFPLIGVLFFHWSIFAILLSYWLENVVIGLYQILKMRKVKMNYPVDQKNSLVMGALRPVTAGERIFYPIFFCVHYGLFLWGHLQLLRFFGVVRGEEVVFTWSILLSAVPFFITHGKLYFEKYIGEKQYEHVPLAKLFVGPYRRIFVMHITIILGSIPLVFLATLFPQAAVLVVLLKIVLDVLLKEKEFAFWNKIEKKFVVHVVDHAHYMEPDAEYTRGEFTNRGESEAKCKEIIDRSLEELFSVGMSAEDLFKQFMLYGEEASCEGFDSMEYIRLRCTELSNKK